MSPRSCHVSWLLGSISRVGFWLCSVLGMSSLENPSMLIICGNYKMKGRWGEGSSFESLHNSSERNSQSSDTNALKFCVNAHTAVLLLVIQTTLKQMCEALESQTCKERGTRGRAGCRQARNQERTASQLKTN